jgi:PAS domain S-box-containing protein
VTLHYPDHDRWYESHAYPAEEGVSIYFRNVTERVHAEERERWLLAEAALANTKFRAFFEQGPLFAGIMALDGTIIESNRLSLEACGYTREDVVGKFFWECPWWRNSGDAAERIRAATARAAAGETFRAEMPYYVADGSERIVDLIVMPIKDESGAVVFLAPTGTDITDRKRAEDALRESEQRFRSLADSVPVHVWMDDEQGRGILANARYVEYSGQSVEDLLKNSWPDILHPDDKDRFLDEFGAAFTARDQFRGEVRLRNREGIYRWFDVIGRPRLEGERFAGYVGISVDVTARKLAEEALSQSEERFRHLAAAMPQIVWIARPDHTVEFYNKRWFQYTGLGVEETYQADGWRLPVHPDDIDRILEASARAEASGEPFEAEFRLRDRYGVYRWHLGRAVAVRDREGRVVRRFGTTTDIDDRKQAEAALLAARDEAEEANRAKTQFLAVLSHELRTPLNPILLAASSMLDRPTEPDEIRPTLEMIRQNVNLQARLIDDLLDVMRIVRGKMPLHWEVADCHDLIDHAIQICRSEVSGGNLRLETDLAAKHHHINADPARWQQVLWNLIKNAVKFTPGGGTITIRTLNEEDHDGRGVRLVIEISDTGIGIAPEVLPRIFEPFQQGETTITRKFGGLGLGLAISRGIVEGHGGTITVESSGEGAGSTFRVELPSLPSPGSSGVGHATRFASGPARVMPLRILVVEDEPATLRLMARLLSGLGHEVTTANSITTALDRLATAEFDLVISDIGLPDGTGLELMRRIVASLGPVPAIALTGYGMEDDIQRSREAGFASHMTKPIDFTKLEAMIGRLVTGQGPEGQVPLPEGDKCP